MEIFDNIFKPQNWKEKGEKKTPVQRYIYVCTLNKVWKNMLGN